MAKWLAGGRMTQGESKTRVVAEWLTARILASLRHLLNKLLPPQKKASSESDKQAAFESQKSQIHQKTEKEEGRKEEWMEGRCVMCKNICHCFFFNFFLILYLQWLSDDNSILLSQLIVNVGWTLDAKCLHIWPSFKTGPILLHGSNVLSENVIIRIKRLDSSVRFAFFDQWNCVSTKTDTVKEKNVCSATVPCRGKYNVISWKFKGHFHFWLP